MLSPVHSLKFCSARARIACGAWARISITRTFLKQLELFTAHLISPITNLRSLVQTTQDNRVGAVLLRCVAFKDMILNNLE